MTKNSIVTDINGNVTGTTYPKRARGLIKSGRATEVDEHTIRLVSSVFTDAFSYETEETKMAHIIDFKARGFKLVPECTSNRGTRLIVTENEENVECFEIGENGMKTEIARTIDLQKDQDYVFRFTIKSRFVKGESAESMVSIYFDEKDDGYTYPLDREDKNRFKPVLCKKTDDGLLRVFELPFNSGDSESCTIDITVHDMIAWLYPAKEAEAYSALEDISYDQWRQDELHRVAKDLSDIGDSIGETMVGTLSGFGELVGKAGDKLAKTVSDVINRPSSSGAAQGADDTQKDDAAADAANATEDAQIKEDFDEEAPKAANESPAETEKAEETKEASES